MQKYYTSMTKPKIGRDLCKYEHIEEVSIARTKAIKKISTAYRKDQPLHQNKNALN